MLKDALKINLTSDINETIGGWFTEQINRMPAAGDLVEFEGWAFEVKKIQAHRIERMRIFKIQQEEEE